jgi:hypothetical protein
MSGPLRIRFVAVLILAGFSTSPAAANPFTALFNPAPDESPPPAPAKDAPAPAKDAPAKDECLSRPGKPADGQHWMYHLDGHRRCWFLAPEEIAAVRKRAHRHAAKPQLEENEAGPRKPKLVVDARAELLRPSPAETPQPAPPTSPTPSFKVVDAATPVPAAGAAALVPPPPVLAKPDQLKPDQLTRDATNPGEDDPHQNNPREDNVETLLAATPVNSDSVAVSVAPATHVAVPTGTREDGPWWTAPWLGPLLIGLGLVLLVSPTRPLRKFVRLAARLPAREAEGRPDLPRSESDSQIRPHDHDHTQAVPPRARRMPEHHRRPRPFGPGNRDLTFQEAIGALTEFDAISVEARSTPFTPRHADAAPADSLRSRTKGSRMS